MRSSCFSVLPASAEAQVVGVALKSVFWLLTLSVTFRQKYQNPFTCVKVRPIASKRWDVFRHSVEDVTVNISRAIIMLKCKNISFSVVFMIYGIFAWYSCRKEGKWSLTCITLYYQLVISKALRYGTSNKGSRTRLSTSGISHTCLYFPAGERHRTLAGTCFPYRWG